MYGSQGGTRDCGRAARRAWYGLICDFSFFLFALFRLASEATNLPNQIMICYGGEDTGPSRDGKSGNHEQSDSSDFSQPQFYFVDTCLPIFYLELRLRL